MRIIDSHFHWWPRSVSERFCRRTAYPRAGVNSKGGYTYMRQKRADYELSSWAEWFDLDKQLEHMDGLGHQVDVVCSIGPWLARTRHCHLSLRRGESVRYTS